MRTITGIPKKFFEEILLYSGQFALFYIIMQLIIGKRDFFTDPSHLGLTAALILQALLLAGFGSRRPYRLGFSFIVPVVYSLIEYSEGINYLLNAAHVGFWFYALASSLLLIIRINRHAEVQQVTDFLLILLNVFIFLFLYFYFDTWKEVQDDSLLVITRIFENLAGFLADPTHWYIIVGGLFLAVTIALGRYEVTRLKDRITALFGKYVDSNVRDAIITGGEYAARKENLCVLFSDIIHFTSLCEKHEAGKIADMLNVYFEYWNGIVKKHSGTVDKYIGDAIMVLFGLNSRENSCDLAASCAMEAYENRHQLYRTLESRELPRPEGFGAGCHYGELIIGDIGSSERKNFTVVGDTVNIASRLESATRKLDSPIVISGETFTRLSPAIQERFSLLGKIDLKGKTEGIGIWGFRTGGRE